LKSINLANCPLSINVACGKKPPTFTEFEPGYGNAGSKVVLIGDGFSTDINKNEVAFNSEPGKVLSATATRLVVIAPDIVSTGRSSVKTDGSLPAYSNGNFTVVPESAAYPVTDTGITDCFNFFGYTSCTGDNGDFPRQDADFINVPNAPSFTGPTQHTTYTNDYTTKDNITGLTWTSCTLKKTGSNCQSSYSLPDDKVEDECTLLNQLNDGNGYAGIKTWRLPGVEELLTLGTKYFRINTIYFPDINDVSFQTSNKYVTNSVNIRIPIRVRFYNNLSTEISYRFSLQYLSTICVSG
jgi:hypothetical protein